ncbi:electron transfer flavoprotein subunit alpha/FixB family protein [Moraxella sp. 179-F 1C4 NHS]|uniref:Electron transfer flavoprotein subunit alpha n=1 Tax=Faucicola osloensis TaxID=34062 RepID=A0AAW6TCD9_FAUOS|nr:MULTISPECIES: FAD-binding protein [Moraxella]NOX78590.1 electron transfer flavoprotein subunit alpha [Gammaproteobacteria bacterium]RVU84914.1 electron transfer flavoprotein subunit alpha [Leucothrix sargassi]TGP49417.1 electron transfer flavoprotein subunit alpha [bacterium M00.F.Ca.ET.230.01.1.1]MBW4008451.1 electron transfer flavoprotein subunit alpha [Moraxella osloensis]MDI4508795.1 electron transfer flavoprotein subunit alpha [Moraxella osloensis]
MAILVYAEHDNKELKKATLNTVTAASKIGGDIVVLVAGLGCEAVAEQAAKVAGVSKVLCASNAAFEHQLAENVAKLVVSLAGDYSHIVAPATTTGKNFLPRVAALLDVNMLTDVTAVIDAETFERPIYAGNAIATVKDTESKKVITVRTTAFDAAAAEGGAASIEQVSAGEDAGKSKFVGEELAKSDRPELTAAEIVVSGGRALASGENFTKYIEPLADKLGAAMGASRAAVDAGYVPNDLQVGQTGKIVAPNLYIAAGISGAIQHLAGMKDSKVIVAINNDPEAPISQVADYFLEGDIFTVLPELTSKL